MTLDGAPLDADSLLENISGLNNLVFLSVVGTDVTSAIVDKLDLPKLKNVRWEGTPAETARESVEK